MDRPAARNKTALILSSVCSAEVQAISIYEAEVFWIRRPERRTLLREILEEELAHDEGLRPWSRRNSIKHLLDRFMGWGIGTFLAALPWSWMCRIQGWAEEEAARIYEKTAEKLKRDEGAFADNLLLQRLEHARDQERVHAQRFRALLI